MAARVCFRPLPAAAAAYLVSRAGHAARRLRDSSPCEPFPWFSELCFSAVTMIGDPKQLPATLLSAAAARAGFGRSLFERLQGAGHPVVLLNEQYRMHPAISMHPSTLFYNGCLRCGVGNI